jgi:REase_MTES_1575/Transcriptional regulator, AbiEi antitoxin
MRYARSTPETHLARFADRQHGVFTIQQALEAGLTRPQLKRRVLNGQVVAVDHGIYRSATTPTSWKQRLIAACLAGPAVASHRSAAALWELPGDTHELVEVSALRHQRRHAKDVVWHESLHLSPRDVTTLQGIPVTRPTRTFVDLASVLDANALEELLHEGMRRNLLSIESVWRRYEQLGTRRRGAGKVREVIERHVAGQRPHESVLETRFAQVVRDAGLPRPASQYELRSSGELVARVDFAYPQFRLAIELDGERWHSGRSVRQSDNERQNRLVAVGWVPLRFSWLDVCDRSEFVVHQLRAALSRPA